MQDGEIMMEEPCDLARSLTDATLKRLAALHPRTLATMHGSVYVGNGSQALLDLRCVS